MHCRTDAAVAGVGVVVDVGVGIRADELILRHFFDDEHLQKFPSRGRIFSLLIVFVKKLFISFKNRDTKEKGLIFTFHMGPLYIMPKGQFMIVCSRETIINLQVDPTTRLAS